MSRISSFDCLRLDHGAERLHHLGARATSEFLTEQTDMIGEQPAILRSLLINNVHVLYSNGRAWAGMPGKPLIGANGTGLRDDKGKQRYVSILEWTSRESSDRFSEAAIAAIERLHGSLDASEAA